MRWLVLVAALIGCEHDDIAACGRACSQTDTRQMMLSYSKTEGCKCAPLSCGDGGIK